MEGSRIAASFMKVIAASAVMGAVTWLVHATMMSLLPGGSLALQMVRLLVTITLSLATLAGTAQVLRIQEYAEARDLIVGRLRRMAG
jgi:peptidoglycan biosynthesis protein MviN/MurJ (putative lipid II flippase)